MGYPMTYSRVLSRNSLGGNYTHVRVYSGRDGIANAPSDWHDERDPVLHMIAGDMRRLERDATESGYWRSELARRAGVDEETLVRVLTAFWDGPLPAVPPHDE